MVTDLEGGWAVGHWPAGHGPFTLLPGSVLPQSPCKIRVFVRLVLSLGNINNTCSFSFREVGGI